MSFADQLPNRQFTDVALNEKIFNSGPPTIDSDSEFNRNSTIMSRLNGLDATKRDTLLANKIVKQQSDGVSP